MGLSGRKVKQRIPNDPRNLSWANDASKFGASYLSKFGWNPSTGLGPSGEGRTSAIAVHQKLDMLGIGADHRNSENGTAWKQNKDFENLLRRLNNASTDDAATGGVKIGGFARATAEHAAATVAEEEDDEEKDVASEEKVDKKKKRKHAEIEDAAAEDNSEKKSKKKDKKDKKDKKRKSEELESESVAAATSDAVSVTQVSKTTVVVSRPVRAHRARHIASKTLASKSSAAISEILGIASAPASTSASRYPSIPPSPSPSAPTTSTPTPATDVQMQELKTSGKSVMDYFREKLAAKSGARAASEAAATPSGADSEEMDDYAERPRGLGAGIGTSRLRGEVSIREEASEEGQGRAGLGARAMFSAMFASASTTVAVTATKVVEEVQATVVDQQEDAPKEGKKKDKKEKRDKKGKRKEVASGDEIQQESSEGTLASAFTILDHSIVLLS